MIEGFIDSILAVITAVAINIIFDKGFFDVMEIFGKPIEKI